MNKLGHTLFEKAVEWIAKYLIWLSNRAEKKEQAQKRAEEEAHFHPTGLRGPKSGKTAGKGR